MKLIVAIKKRIMNFLYNEDRAIASLSGAPAQETISSEIGRHKNDGLVVHEAAKVLDGIQAKHTENAVRHADALNKVDDGFEG